MNKVKDLFKNLDKTDLKIMKIGLRISFFIILFSVFLLCIYLRFVHSIFLYNIAIAIFKLSTYIGIEFIICGIVVDTIKKELE